MAGAALLPRHGFPFTLVLMIDHRIFKLENVSNEAEEVKTAVCCHVRSLRWVLVLRGHTFLDGGAEEETQKEDHGSSAVPI